MKKILITINKLAESRHKSLFTLAAIFGILLTFAGLTSNAPKAHAAFKGYTVVTNSATVTDVNSEPTVEADCPSGYNAVGGGGHYNNSVTGTNSYIMQQNYPVTSGDAATGWTVTWNQAFAGDTVTAYAVCAKVSK